MSISTFSRDISYSRCPAASRASCHSRETVDPNDLPAVYLEVYGELLVETDVAGPPLIWARPSHRPSHPDHEPRAPRGETTPTRPRSRQARPRPGRGPGRRSVPRRRGLGSPRSRDRMPPITAARSRRLKSRIKPSASSTLSRDIAYSDSPAASRTSASLVKKRHPMVFPWRYSATCHIVWVIGASL